MLRENGSFVIFALFLMFFCDSTSSECMQSTPCLCTLPNGLRYDLTNLSNLGVLTSNDTSHTFYFQACKNVHFQNIDSNSECNKGGGVSLCAQDNVSKKISVLGTVEDTKMELQSGININPILMLHHGNTTTMITLLCCVSCHTDLKVDSANAGQYHLLLVSPYVCKIAPHVRGLSTGSILVILFLVFSGLYFIGGAMALKFLRGATGWEMLPNHEFWCELPSLVKDGVIFTFSCCRANSYDRI